MYTKIITLVLVAVFTNATYAFSKNDDVLKLKVTDNKEKVARAEILNLDDSNEYYEDLKVIELVGKKTQTKDVLNIDWNKIKLGEVEIPISPPFSSKVKVAKDIKKGNKFSAKGSYSHLISSMEELFPPK